MIDKFHKWRHYSNPKYFVKDYISDIKTYITVEYDKEANNYRCGFYGQIWYLQQLFVNTYKNKPVYSCKQAMYLIDKFLAKMRKLEILL